MLGLGNLELDVEGGEARPFLYGPLVFDDFDTARVGLEDGAHDTFPFGLVGGAAGLFVEEGGGSPHVLNLLTSGGKSGDSSGSNEKLHLFLFLLLYCLINEFKSQCSAIDIQQK